MKFKSIFKAFEGGHLDGALFGERTPGARTETRDAQADTPTFPRRGDRVHRSVRVTTRTEGGDGAPGSDARR